VLLLYCAATKNSPRVYPEAVAPAIVSGLIWATAQVSWFFANSQLGNVIAFPVRAGRGGAARGGGRAR